MLKRSLEDHAEKQKAAKLEVGVPLPAQPPTDAENLELQKILLQSRELY